MTLPLPLTPFERYMLSDQCPGYPMSFFLQCRFSGDLDMSRLQPALNDALAHHPLLRATICRTGHLEWRDCPVEPVIHVLRHDAARPRPAPIELDRQPGLRLTLLERHPGGARLRAEFHHACCDALGAMAFLEDLLIAYARRGSGVSQRPVFPPRDEATLLRRGVWERPVCTPTQWVQRRLIGLMRSWRCLSGRPRPLGQCNRDWEATAPEVFPSACLRELDADETAALVDGAGASRSTVNDLLVRDWFLALDDWRGRQSASGRDRLRVCVPIDLRTEMHAGIPAANVVSMVFIDRRRRDMADPSRLLRSIHGELDRVKRFRLGGSFLAGINITQRLPRRLVRAIHGRRCWSSAVLSNLGRVLEAGSLTRRQGRLALPDAVLEGVDFLPPLRARTHASMGVLTYAGRMTLALHYDARAIGSRRAEDLMETFLRRLRESIATASRKPYD